MIHEPFLGLNPSYKINIYIFVTSNMLPDRCTVKKDGKRCPNPPEFIISVLVDTDEYMIGVTCRLHKKDVSEKIKPLQQKGKIPNGKINFESLRTIGTDCIKGDADDLIQI